MATISLLPTPPSRKQSPDSFSDDADNFLGALPKFRDELNAFGTTVADGVNSAYADAIIATDQAAIATTQASVATTQASIATTQASAATLRASEATVSAEAVRIVYLGAKPTDPTVDNQGNVLIDGALYYNSTTHVVRVYDLAVNSWADATSAVINSSNRYRFVATSGQTVFGGLTYDSGYVDVYKNGVLLDPATQFTETGSGTSIKLSAGATAGDKIFIIAYGNYMFSKPIPAETGKENYFLSTTGGVGPNTLKWNSLNTINGLSVVGSGDLTPVDLNMATRSTTINGKPLSADITLTPDDLGAQPALVNTANIKSINGDSILGSGDLAVKSNLVDAGASSTLVGTGNNSITTIFQTIRNNLKWLLDRFDVATGKATAAINSDSATKWSGSTKTISTSPPSGGVSGDIWFEVES